MKLNFQNIDEKTRNLLPKSVYEFITSSEWADWFLVAEINPEYRMGNP